MQGGKAQSQSQEQVIEISSIVKSFISGYLWFGLDMETNTLKRMVTYI